MVGARSQAKYTCDGYDSGEALISSDSNCAFLPRHSDNLQKVGDCPQNSHCAYIHEIPFCVGLAVVVEFRLGQPYIELLRIFLNSYITLPHVNSSLISYEIGSAILRLTKRYK